MLVRTRPAGSQQYGAFSFCNVKSQCSCHFGVKEALSYLYATVVVHESEGEDAARSRSYLENQMAVALGGRVAEELIFGENDVTTGASGDFMQARQVTVKRMQYRVSVH